MKRHTAAGRKTFKRRRKEVINRTYQRPMGLFTDLPEEIIQVSFNSNPSLHLMIYTKVASLNE